MAKINIIEVLKSDTGEDMSMIKGPIIMLVLFFVIGAVFFPKPSNIYKDGVLKSCTCIGLKATPRVTKGSKIGDVYCLGIPIKCTKQKILKPDLNGQK